MNSERSKEDEFIVRKAACRVVLARTVNDLLGRWRDLPEQEQLQDALVATMADLTAEVALGVKAPTKEQFLDFMGKAYEVYKAKHDGT